jgi:hypothetical protein
LTKESEERITNLFEIRVAFASSLVFFEILRESEDVLEETYNVEVRFKDQELEEITDVREFLQIQTRLLQIE